MADPLIVDIKRHGLEDGPGIRSVVFFKGCPLRCVFCHNPEAQRFEAEILFRPTACIDCRDCVAVCASGAIPPGGPVGRDPERCTACGACSRVCPSSALSLVGQPLSVAEIVQIVLRDEAYYRHSGGGVTLSGGECTAFPEFVHELLSALRDHGIHTAIETCGEFAFASFAARILPLVDLILFDVKLADPRAHLRFTGRGNERVWSNLASLLEVAPERVEVRVPLVPGITATDDNLVAIAERALRLGARGLTLLPYNPLGAVTAEGLGRPYPEQVPRAFMQAAETQHIISRFEREMAKSLSPVRASSAART